jgi:outer membrane protein assembly factor BamB
MRSHISWISAFCLVLATTSPYSWGQISSVEARKLGLEIAWQTHVQLPLARTGVVSSHLRVEPGELRKYAIVELENRTIRVSADKLDRKGKPLGIEGAKAEAAEQVARLQLGQGGNYPVEEVSVPQISLTLVTSDGYVQKFDAESGQLLWKSSCDGAAAPAHPAAVSPQGLVLVHGTKLYVLDWQTGKHRLVKNLAFASSNAVTVSKDIAYVADFSGRIEAYGLAEKQYRWGYVVSGRAVGAPVNLADHSYCALATDKGYVYVFASGDNPAVWIRYEAASPIIGSLAASADAFYAGSVAGLMSKFQVDDRLGRIAWEYRTGQTISAPPLVTGEQVIVATEIGDVFSINDSDGSLHWTQPNMDAVQPIARTAGKIFCTSRAGGIYALNEKTGEVVSRSGMVRLGKPIVNQINDRLYVLGAGGALQCLRPLDGDLPTMTVANVSVGSEAKASEAVQDEAPAVESSESPFGASGGGDPFNPSAGAMPAASDPFGTPAGGADPFGAPASGADPFGAPPFGGSGAASDPFAPTGGGASPF